LAVADPSTGERKELRVRIPRGARDGSRIRIRGKGGPGGNGGPPGDLILVAHLREDPRFRLEGRDLYSPLRISPWDAILGTKVSLPTLEGIVTLTVPPSSSTGRKIRLRGRGYITAKGERGDLFAEVQIVVPEQLSDEERGLVQRLRALRGGGDRGSQPPPPRASTPPPPPAEAEPKEA